MKKKYNMIKVDSIFKDEIEDIKLKRIRLGYDDIKRSDRRITKAIRRLSEWEKIKTKIIQSKMEQEDDI